MRFSEDKKRNREGLQALSSRFITGCVALASYINSLRVSLLI
jgi:hypothetical protein